MACIYKINGKTFSTTNEIQNYIDSDEFISVLAKGNLGISKEIRNLILNKDEKTTNEVREEPKIRQGEKGNEGGQQSRKENGQETNVQENEVLTEGGVKTPKSEISSTTEEKVSDALKDVESTAKALAADESMFDKLFDKLTDENANKLEKQNLSIEEYNKKIGEFNKSVDSPKKLSEAYHNAKAKPEAQRSASDNELITSVETLLKPKEYATQEVKQPKGVRTEPKGGIKGGETKVTGVSDSVQRAKESEKEKVAEGVVTAPTAEPTETEVAQTAQKAGVTPKNLRDLYRISRDLFGQSKDRAFAIAIAMDRMIGAMAKRAGVTKEQMYGRLKFRKASEQDLPQGVKFQVDAWHGSPYQFDKFTTEKIGTGEGAQAFGWGLYFTDLESIAKDYAEKLAKSLTETVEDVVESINYLEDWQKKLLIEIFDDVYQNIDNAINVVEKRVEKEKKRLHGVINNTITDYLETGWTKDDYVKRMESVVDSEQKILKGLIELKPKLKNKNLYKVSLHKGKTPDQYTWLEWDKPVSSKTKKSILDFISKDEKYTHQTWIEAKRKIKYALENDLDVTNEDLYKRISGISGLGQKEASLFLLDAGIDGVKYPAESIARGATSENARGFNYVVFDENVVSIEEVIKFQKDAEKARGAVMVSMDGQAVIYALTDPNVSTPLHEMAHVFEHYLNDAERAAVQNWAGTKAWTTQTSEAFARGFEKYLAEGKAPNNSLQKIFDKFKTWLTDIYNGITGSDIDIELNEPMREIYAQMLGVDIQQTETSKPKPENVKAIEEAMTKKSGTIKNEIIKEAADPTEVKKILDNLDSIKSKLAGLTTKDGDSVFSEECKWG